MKTLDEVLEAIKTKSGLKLSSRRKDDRWEVPIDLYQEIIHYLKEYKTLQYGYIKAMADLEDNPPLTWDELCKMEDTPVWLEWSSDGAWVMIAYKVDNDLEFFRYGEDRIFVLTRDDYEPDKWQAYRKERC